jgi:hypothetical protein
MFKAEIEMEPPRIVLLDQIAPLYAGALARFLPGRFRRPAEVALATIVA